VDYKLLKMSLLGELTHQWFCIAKELTNVKKEKKRDKLTTTKSNFPRIDFFWKGNDKFCSCGDRERILPL